MKDQILESCHLLHLNQNELCNENGGYGYYPGMFKDAKAANSLLSESWSDFRREFMKGYNDNRLL